MESKHALTLLNRLAQRREHVQSLLTQALDRRLESLAEVALEIAIETGDPIGSVLAALIRDKAPFDLVERLMDTCLEVQHQNSIPLGEVQYEAICRCLQHYRTSWLNPDEEQKEILAGLFNNLGISLAGIGRVHEALEAAQEAVDRYHKLGSNSSPGWLLDYARALNSLGARLADLGCLDEASVAAREATTLLRREDPIPQTYLPMLAVSLNNLADSLGLHGQLEEAIDIIEESIFIRRRLLDSAKSTRTLSGLASSLNDLSVWLREAGRPEDSSRAGHEAIDIYRQLASGRPDIFLPDLAMSLDNLSSIIEGMELWDDALLMARESISIYRELLKHHYDSFLPHLARSLGNLGVLLSSLDQSEPALSALQECIHYYRNLSKSNPGKFLAPLAGNINNIANHLGEIGRQEESLELMSEAICTQRKIVEEFKGVAALFDLSRYLNNYGLWLSRFGHNEDALKALREAVDLRRRLACDQPDAFRSYFVGSVYNLSSQLSEMGFEQESLDLLTEVSERHPTAENL